MPHRMTPQTKAALLALEKLGHATNRQITRELRVQFPSITPTTVHRITARLVDEGLIAYAPSVLQDKILDFNAVPHDHFFCRGCAKLVDIQLSDESIAHVQAQLPGTLLRRDILVSGICDRCADSA